MAQVDSSATQNPEILSNNLTIIFGVIATFIAISGVGIRMFQYWRTTKCRNSKQPDDVESQPTAQDLDTIGRTDSTVLFNVEIESTDPTATVHPREANVSGYDFDLQLAKVESFGNDSPAPTDAERRCTMQWPSWARFWRQKPDEDDKTVDAPKQSASVARSAQPPNTTPTQQAKPYSWESNLNTTDWTHYTTPQTLAFSVATAAATLGLVSLWKTYLRRIPTVSYLKPGFFHRRSVFGYVTRVGDGDNFHLFHTPGGRLLGWGWAPGRRVGTWKGKELKGKTMHVRLAGVDAPEAAHFGRPAQPYSQEALDWLKAAVLGRWVRVWPYREDQYKRVVSSVQRRRFLFFKRDVGLDMLKTGLATVYEAKYGSEFGNREEEYRAAEETAKRRKVGMWSEPGLVARMLGKKKESVETPREYKTRMTGQEKGSDMAK